jgi:hypothetical protein
VDCGVDSIKDGYTAEQVPAVAAAAFLETGEKSIEGALRTWLDFLLGHSMLLWLGNRLALELPDHFALPLLKEGPSGSNSWCLVAQMEHAECRLSSLISSSFSLYPFTFLALSPLEACADCQCG